MKKKSPLICLCNAVEQKTIEQAIESGCHTLTDIYDTTTAGVGPCGGSCRSYLQKMLKQYLESKTFPEVVRPPRKKRR